MHIFGLVGTLVFIIGFLSALYIGAEKIYYLSQHIPARLVTDNPYFYISLVCMMMGTQLFLAGFLGELIARNSPDRNNYQVSKELL